MHTFQSQRILHAFETLQTKKTVQKQKLNRVLQIPVWYFLVCGLFPVNSFPVLCKSKPNKSIHSTLHVECVLRLSGMHSSLLY